MLEFVEAGTEQAADLGYGQDAYFAALGRKVKEIVEAVDALPEASRQTAVTRLIKLGEYQDVIEWGYGDFLGDVAATMQARRTEPEGNHETNAWNSAWQSAAVTTTVHAGLAVLFGGNVLVCSWAWWRAKPGSGDAMVLPTLILLSAAMLIGILPRLLWPRAEALGIAGSVASAFIVTSMAVVQIRKRRLRRQARSV